MSGNKQVNTKLVVFKYSNRQEIKMNNSLLTPLFVIMLIAGLASGSMAGHNYHGYGMQMSEDGSEFIMEWKIFPIVNSEKRTSHFLAVQRAVENNFWLSTDTKLGYKFWTTRKQLRKLIK
jgi:hypothetical protein